MQFDQNLAAIHAYLCADGYVVKNPEKQKQRYYHIGLRNTNLVLLKDFQEKFYNYFHIEPRLMIGQRCIIQNKAIYENLISKFGSFYSRSWTMPKLNKNFEKIWLRAFFDCEGWVFCKSHQNRHIGLDSVNEKGIDQIAEVLRTFDIYCIKKINKKRKMFRIFIYGKNNLKKFRNEIGFLHPDKKKALDLTVSDFVNYSWNLSENIKLTKKIMLKKAKIKKPYIARVISQEEDNLKKLKTNLVSLFGLDTNSVKISKRTNGIGTGYFELNVNKKLEVKKLIKQNLINTEQLSKIERIKI